MNRRAIHEPWPKAHRMAPPDLRSDNASYARPLDRAHNLTSLVATRSESLPITSRAGNDRNASPGELDFMYGGVTRRHEGCVSAMLTESGLSIALRARRFKGLCAPDRGRKTKSRRYRLLSV